MNRTGRPLALLLSALAVASAACSASTTASPAETPSAAASSSDSTPSATPSVTSSPTVPPPWKQPRSFPSDNRSQDELMAAREESLTSLWASHFTSESKPVPPRPTVKLVRWVDPGEELPVMADCLRKAGWKVDASTSQLSTDVPEGRELEAHVAEYTCVAQYSIKPARQPGQESMALMHQYLREWWVPCLRMQGWKAPTLPPEKGFTRKQLIAVVDKAASANSLGFEDIEDVCPSSP